MLATASRRTIGLAAGAAFAAGALASVQGRINGELSSVLDAPVDAALWSFGSGLLVLSVAMLASRRARDGIRSLRQAVRDGSIKPWHCLGGLAGGAFVGIQTYAVPLAGVALFTIAVVGGQTFNALVVDKFGLGPAGGAPVTLGRVLAAGFAVVGVTVSVLGRGGGVNAVLLPAVLAFLAGAMNVAQQAINGRVNVATRNPASTTWLNFVLGTTFLGGLALVELATGHLPSVATLDVPWWSLLGGLCGVVFIGISAIVVRHLGVLVFTLTLLSGQLVAAVGLDLLSAQTRAALSVQVFVGVVITLVAAMAAGAAASRTRPTARD